MTWSRSLAVRIATIEAPRRCRRAIGDRALRAAPAGTPLPPDRGSAGLANGGGVLLHLASPARRPGSTSGSAARAAGVYALVHQAAIDRDWQGCKIALGTNPSANVHSSPCPRPRPTTRTLTRGSSATRSAWSERAKATDNRAAGSTPGQTLDARSRHRAQRQVHRLRRDRRRTQVRRHGHRYRVPRERVHLNLDGVAELCLNGIGLWTRLGGRGQLPDPLPEGRVDDVGQPTRVQHQRVDGRRVARRRRRRQPNPGLPDGCTVPSLGQTLSNTTDSLFHLVNVRRDPRLRSDGTDPGWRRERRELAGTVDGQRRRRHMHADPVQPGIGAGRHAGLSRRLGSVHPPSEGSAATSSSVLLDRDVDPRDRGLPGNPDPVRLRLRRRVPGLFSPAWPIPTSTGYLQLPPTLGSDDDASAWSIPGASPIP